jgi:LysM repeat protein
MGAQPASNSARILAPVALAVCAVAFFAVILSSGTGNEERGDQADATNDRPSSRTKRQSQRRKPTASTYTVKTGDTLAGIAEKTGVPVEKIQEINPQLDPQALVSGQKIKLRE